jgi:hypothetical protein
MTSQEIKKQLDGKISGDGFAVLSYELTDAWSAANVGLEAVEPILQFMEDHEELDYGMPGPLSHFIEKFYRKGYEPKLLQSVKRKPTEHTT